MCTTLPHLPPPHKLYLGDRPQKIPVGNYNPDWAISFKHDSVRHIYFVAETKGSLSSMELRGIEKAKIDCARKFFKKITSADVTYDVVDNYGTLMKLVGTK